MKALKDITNTAEMLIREVERTLERAYGGRRKSDANGLRSRLYRKRKQLMEKGECGPVGIVVELRKGGRWVEATYLEFVRAKPDDPCRICVVPSLVWVERMMDGITDADGRPWRLSFGATKLSLGEALPPESKQVLRVQESIEAEPEELTEVVEEAWDAASARLRSLGLA